MKKRGQVILDFLMTYGWAIMVALTAIGLLIYFGVLKPENIILRECVFKPGIACMDYEVDENTVTMVLKNKMGEDITIISITAEGCSSLACGFLEKGEQDTFIAKGCSNDADGKFNGKINITYTGESKLVHINKGKIVDKVAGSGNYFQNINSYLEQISLVESTDAGDTRDGMCPGGVETIDTSFRNNDPIVNLSNIYFEVITLPADYSLLNSDCIGGVSAIASVPDVSLGVDGILTPGESFSQEFEICLPLGGSAFIFNVDVFGLKQ